jgi:hypothetical protein
MHKQAFGDEALGQMQTYDSFKNRQMSVDEDERSG